MSSTHSPHLLFSPKKKSNNNENNHSFSYEVISTLESTGVHFRTSIDPGSYVPAHLHHAIEIIYLLEGNLTVIMESSVREYMRGVYPDQFGYYSFYKVYLSEQSNSLSDTTLLSFSVSPGCRPAGIQSGKPGRKCCPPYKTRYLQRDAGSDADCK